MKPFILKLDKDTEHSTNDLAVFKVPDSNPDHFIQLDPELVGEATFDDSRVQVSIA